MGVNIPISVARNDEEGDSKKLDVIIPSMRGLVTYTSIVGCIDDEEEIGNEYFSGQYMIAGVNRGVTTTTTPSASASMDTHPVSCSFFLWLLGGDFPNTTALFMDKAIYLFCPCESHVLLYLRDFMTTAELSVSVRPKFRIRRADEIDSELLNYWSLYDATAALWRTRTSHPDPVIIIGYIDGETPNSKGILHSCCGCGSVCVPDETRFQTTNVISGFVKLLLNEEEEDDVDVDEVLHEINKQLQPTEDEDEEEEEEEGGS